MVVFPISIDIVSMLLYFPTEEEPKKQGYLVSSSGTLSLQQT